MEEEIQRVLNDPLENLRFEQFSCATYIERLKLVAEEERYLKEICDNLYDKAYNELAVLVKSYADKEHIERRNFNFKLEAQKHELKFLGDCYGCKQSEIPDPGIALGCIINSVEYMYRTNDVFRTFLTNEEFIELFSKHIVQYQSKIENEDIILEQKLKIADAFEMLTNSFKKIVDNDNSALGDFVRESMVILQFTRKAIVRQKESVSIPFVQEFYDMFYKMYRIMFDVAIRNKFLKRQRGEYVAPETEKKTIANQISSVMMAKDLILNEKNIKEEFPHRSGTDLAKGEFLINLIKSSALSPQSSSFLDKSSMMTSKGESIEAFKKHISQFGILNRYEVQYLVELYIKNIEGFDVIKDLVKYVYAIRLQNRIDRASVYLGDNKEMALSVYHLYSEFTMQAVAVEWYTRQGLKPVLQERIDEYKRNNGYTK